MSMFFGDDPPLTFTNQVSDIEELQILNPLLQKNKCYVAGGCFKNFFNGEKPKDIDLFFYNLDALDEGIITFTTSESYIPQYTTDKALGFQHRESGLVVEVIKYKVGTPEQILNTFDFTIAQFAYYMHDTDVPYVMHHDDYFYDLEHRELEIPHSWDKVPPNADQLFNRIHKYITYGFNPTTNTKKILFDKISQEHVVGNAVTPVTRFY